MPIKILKEGKTVTCTYEGSCRHCGCEFEIPEEEAHQRTDFRIANFGLEVPPTMDCPHCRKVAPLKLRTEIAEERKLNAH